MVNLYNMDFNNFNEDVKVKLILTDIPYNIGRDAYASNPQWWKMEIIKMVKVRELIVCFSS